MSYGSFVLCQTDSPDSAYPDINWKHCLTVRKGATLAASWETMGPGIYVHTVLTCTIRLKVVKDQAHPHMATALPNGSGCPTARQCTLLHCSGAQQRAQVTESASRLPPGPIAQDAKVQTQCQTSQDNCTGPMCLPWTEWSVYSPADVQ